MSYFVGTNLCPTPLMFKCSLVVSRHTVTFASLAVGLKLLSNVFVTFSGEGVVARGCDEITTALLGGASFLPGCLQLENLTANS